MNDNSKSKSPPMSWKRAWEESKQSPERLMYNVSSNGIRLTSWKAHYLSKTRRWFSKGGLRWVITTVIGLFALYFAYKASLINTN